MRSFFLIVSLLCGSIVEAEVTYSQVSEMIKNLADKVNGEEITIPEALLSIQGEDIDLMIKPSVIYGDNMKLISEARCASTGAVQGVLCFDLSNLQRLKDQHGSVIWVTDHINNDDLCNLGNIDGIFALKEDPSSHAIIVTRVSNIPCLTLPQDVIRKGKSLETSTGSFHEGDTATLDAFNGKLFSGLVPLNTEINHKLLNMVMDWAEQYSKISVHGNADTAEESRQALEFGARGVDPRTEHMFFHPERLHLFRKVILSKGQNKKALDDLERYQRNDFIGLYQTMKSYPVKIRLLDPPLHEFLPNDETIISALAADLDESVESIKTKVKAFSEVNPMMGNRGVRLLITFPEILKMQARAIFEAALDPSLESYSIEPYIVIPMIINGNEVAAVKKVIDEVLDEITQKTGKAITYHLGVMIETPRACLLAGEIAQHVDFISFGTNDLTGQTLALSRGDVFDKFLKHYLDTGILDADPFTQLDSAVIQLIKITVDQMRQADHAIAIGICGEQASEKTGVFVCSKLGFNTVSCAPTRVPAVKLYAAQAALLQH